MMKSEIEWFDPKVKLPEFDGYGWASDIILFVGKTLYSGRALKRREWDSGVDWYVNSNNVVCDLWAYAPKKPEMKGGE